MKITLLILVPALHLLPQLLPAQSPLATQVIRLGTVASQGVDQATLDSVYVDGFGPVCDHCRFDSARAEVFRESWDRLLNDVMAGCVEHNVPFTEIVLRAYFAADGRIDYLLYHVGDDRATDERFVAVLRAIAETFRFAAASGPFKQSATIRLGG